MQSSKLQEIEISSEEESGADEDVQSSSLDKLRDELMRGRWNYPSKKDKKGNENALKEHENSQGNPINAAESKETPRLEETRRQQEWRQKFKEEHQKSLRSKRSQDENIFHVLAELEKQIYKSKVVVYCVVESCWDLLEAPNTQGMTGLHMAIQRKNYKVVKYILEAWDAYSKADIDSVLKIQCNGNNCIHLAIKSMMPAATKDKSRLDAIKALIKRASKETLTKSNNEGLTPLHLAVECERCTPQQLGIIEELVKKCEKALDERGPKDLSPYQHHKQTYEAWRKDLAGSIGEQQTNQKTPNSQGSHLKRTKNSDRLGGNSTGDPQEEIALGKDKPRDEYNDEKIFLSSTQEQISSPLVENSSRLPPQPKNLRKPPPKQLAKGVQPTFKPPEVQQQMLQRRSSVLAKGMASSKQEDESASSANSVTEESVMEIANYLKQTYLRNNDRTRSLRFLYGDFSEKQLSFNLNGKSGELSEDDFREGYKCAKFDDTLQSVRIPRFVVKPGPTKKAIEAGGNTADDEKDPTEGRKDLCIIFDWLHKEAKVKKIFKVTVDDLGDTPHCDYAIEEALKKFDVEVWDWCKSDLCCETVAKTAPNARRVNLYWSGRNAVLRGWGDPQGGLASLAHLEQVDIFLQSGIEGLTRNKANFNAFKKRLQDCASHKNLLVELHLPNKQRFMAQGSGAIGKTLQNHKWLQVMDGFSEFIKKVPQPHGFKPIKIAIIDDGIDTTKKKLHNRIVGGQFFCEDESPSFCVSAGGHGTNMAILVSRVFPKAEIVSLKLDEHDQKDGSRQFSIQSAANAVRYARYLGVDIINMSWSIEQTDSNLGPLMDLKRAILETCSKNILIFCSANDQGVTDDKSYPGKFAQEAGNKMCKIGAATATGAEFDYVHLESVNYLFPGRIVEEAQEDNVTDNTSGMGHKDRSTEGSSIATAFATGLAGLIFHITQLVSLDCQEQNDPSSRFVNHYTKLRGDSGKMTKIFDRLKSDKKFVEVWRVFKVREELLARGGRDPGKKFEMLQSICSSLLDGLTP
ncbi:intracellular serine protease [Fusarium pseudoanthophilum]|uniref:Intracellular serine protease n=1 Tax=Fusarium pseudoanthophilum TaxID=48495 RepID=A0A8H5NNI2_9HYPO|nr:intracellular serine protease [Fusarium pseudoanthophilum]